MSYQLRDYQEEAVQAGLKGFASGKPFIIQAATGAGKSLMIAELTKRLGEPMLVLCPSKEILEQNYQKMVDYGIEDVALHSASVGKKDMGKIVLATVASIHRKPKEFAHFNYCLFDEVHGFNAKNPESMYSKLFKETGIRKVGGLTATPYRMDQKYFGDIYTGCIKMLNRVRKDSFFREIVYRVEMKDLIEQGYLLKPEYHTYETDLSQLIVNTTGRDYTEESLQEWGKRRLDQMMELVPELDKHNRVLVFCTSVSQSETAQEKLRKVGINAQVLTAKTPKKQREQMVEDFKTGKVKWMLNVATMTTGFDAPALDAVVLLRPTFSVALLVQMVGRCVRIDPNNPDKTAHVYDFTDNIKKFGRVETITIDKEDGFKDMLVSEVGRLDNTPLFTYDKKLNKFTVGAPKPVQQELPVENRTKIEHPKDPSLEYLLSLI